MDDNTRRDMLAQFVDERVTIEGAFDRMSQAYSKQSRELPIWTALLQDVFLHSEGKEIDLGHAWIQHAGDIKATSPNHGERIRCCCRVTSYRKTLDIPNPDGFRMEIKYGLSFPKDIVILGRAVPKRRRSWRNWNPHRLPRSRRHN